MEWLLFSLLSLTYCVLSFVDNKDDRPLGRESCVIIPINILCRFQTVKLTDICKMVIIFKNTKATSETLTCQA